MSMPTSLARFTFRGMATSLTGALAATFAMGFGVPVPVQPVVTVYVVGTAFIAATSVIMIRARNDERRQ